MSLRIWLPLNGNLENQGLSDLKFSIRNAEYTQMNNSGKIGVCYENTAHNNGGIVSDKMIDLGSKQSMCCWINMTDVYSSSSLMGIGGQHRFSANTGMGLTIRYVSATTGYLSVNTGDGSSRTYNKYYGKTLMNTGKWYHVCYTYDGSVVKLYVDGELDATHTVGALSVPAEYVSVFLWSYNHNNYIFSGRINDFRCYDHVLSPAEVKEISKGLVLHYPLNRDGFGADNLIIDTLKDRGNSHTTYNVADFNFSEALVSGDTYTVSAKITVSSEKKGICFYHSGGSYQMGSWTPVNDTGVYTATFTATDAMASQTGGIGYGYCRVYVSNNTAQQGSTAVTGTANVEWIKVEKGGVATPWCPNPADVLYSMVDTTEYDCSGYKHNGIKIGTLGYSGDTPRYHVSTNFPENASSVQVAQVFPYQSQHTEITVSCWFKTNTMNGTAPNFFSFGENYFLRFRLGGGGSQLNCYYISGTKAWSDMFNCNKSMIDNVWHMAACVFKDGVMTCYLDGVEVGSADHSSNATYLTQNISSTTSWHLAGYKENQENFIGNLSDVRMYVTALSAEDVLSLYNTAASIADNGTILTYEFEEG